MMKLLSLWFRDLLHRPKQVMTVMSAAPTRADVLRMLVEVAQSQVGVREEGGNNRGKRVREYQAATSLKPADWPWCAAFVCWCIREWVAAPIVQAVLDVADPERWRPKTARAFGFEAWAKRAGGKVLPGNAEVYAGDLIVFDFSHVGIAIEAAKPGQPVKTIEGNTNGKGERDSRSGDGVWRKERGRSAILHIIRILP